MAQGRPDRCIEPPRVGECVCFLTGFFDFLGIGGSLLPWCITLDNSKGISRLRFWAKKRRVNGINDLPVFMHQGSLQPILAQLPRTISDAVLSGSGREDAERARVVDTIEQQTREAEGQGFDIDAVTESDLAMPARAPSSVTMEDLDRVVLPPSSVATRLRAVVQVRKRPGCAPQ